MTVCDHVVVNADAESFGRWLDRPTEGVGYKTESPHTEQQAAEVHSHVLCNLFNVGLAIDFI